MPAVPAHDKNKVKYNKLVTRGIGQLVTCTNTVLSSRVLYETRNIITVPLKNDWRTANISAIHKKGNKSELCNYHPVSLTCIICKLMEKIIRDYLLDHF